MLELYGEILRENNVQQSSYALSVEVAQWTWSPVNLRTDQLQMLRCADLNLRCCPIIITGVATRSPGP